jgi:hypothetical protein
VRTLGNHCDQRRKVLRERLVELDFELVEMRVSDDRGSPRRLAHEVAAEGDRQRLPTRQDRKSLKATEARQLFEAGNSLEEIASTMEVSVPSARAYLRESFRAEKTPMPDLRAHRHRPFA